MKENTELHAYSIVTSSVLWYHLTFPLGKVTWHLLGQEEVEGVKVPQWKPHGGRRDLRPEREGRGGDRNRERPTWASKIKEKSCKEGLRVHQTQKQDWIQDHGPGAAQFTMSDSIRRRSSSRQLLQNLIRSVGNVFWSQILHLHNKMSRYIMTHQPKQ